MADIHAPGRTGVGLRPTNVVTLREVLGPATRDGFALGAFADRYTLMVRPIRRAAQAMSSQNIPVGRGPQRGPASCTAGGGRLSGSLLDEQRPSRWHGVTGVRKSSGHA
jgi:hypothetical protein